jgi:hypothetical protein
MLPMVVFRYFLRQKGWLESSVGWDMAATSMHRREGAGELLWIFFLWSKVCLGSFSRASALRKQRQQERDFPSGRSAADVVGWTHPTNHGAETSFTSDWT